MTFYGVCRQCNSNFQKKSNVQIFCTESCKNKHYKENHTLLKIYNKVCINCKKEFVSKRDTTKFCSFKCSGIYNAGLGKVGGNRVGLEKFINLYGEQEGTKRYELFKTKISNTTKGRSSSNKGKKYTDEKKKLISESVKNSKYHTSLKGKKLSQVEIDQRIKSGKGVFTLNWFIKKYGEREGLQLLS